MQHKLHIRKYVFCFLIFFAFYDNSFASFFAVVVQGISIEPYNQVFKGIKKSYGNDLKRVVLCGFKGDLKRYIKEKKPFVIFTIGEWALSEVSSIKDIPIVYTMVLNPNPYLSGHKNISGVSMLVSARKKLEYIKKYLPKTKRIGVIYNPGHSYYLYKELLDAAKDFKVSIVAKKVFSSQQVIDAIKKISQNIDLFFMLPDVTVISPETLSFMNLFFLKKSIPIVTFSEKYLKLGALMAIYSEPFSMGVQAGILAKKILKGTVMTPVTVCPDERFKINSYVAECLGLPTYEGNRREMIVHEDNEKDKEFSPHN